MQLIQFLPKAENFYNLDEKLYYVDRMNNNLFHDNQTPR